MNRPERKKEEPSFKIEKGVPFPKIRSKGGRMAKYPWAKMTEVGDSVEIPIGERDPNKFRVAIRVSISYYKSKNEGTDFTSRIDKEKNVFRVWRTK